MYKSKRGIAAIVIGIIIIVFSSLVLFSYIVMGNARLLPYKGIISSDPYDIYDLGSVLVVDQYGYIESDSEWDEDYYIIAFTAENDDTIYLGSLCVDESMDIYEKLRDYAYDETMYIGDLYIDLCASANTAEVLDRDIHSFYGEAVTEYESLLPGFEDSGMSFTYYCEGAQAFPQALEAEKQTDIIVIVIFAVILAAGIALLAAGINKRIKVNKSDMFMPQQKIYYNPQFNNQSNMQQNNNQRQQNGAYGQPAYYRPVQEEQNRTAPPNNTNIYYTPPGEKYSNDYNNGSQNPPDGGNENQNG